MSAHAIQLYSVRDRPEPLPGLIREVAAAGFDGVEFATRALRSDPKQVKAALKGTGLEPVAAHVEFSMLKQDIDSLIDRYSTIGCNRLVIPHLPIEQFRTPSELRTLMKELTKITDRLKEADMTLAIHTTRELLFPLYRRKILKPLLARDDLPRGIYNHAGWLGSKGVNRDQSTLIASSPLGHIATNLDAIEYEIDAKSVVTAGFPIDEVLQAFRGKVELIHLSDVRRIRRFPPDFEPVMPGHGLVDPAAVLTAANRYDIPWVIAEHDNPDDPTNVIDALGEVLGHSRGRQVA